MFARLFLSVVAGTLLGIGDPVAAGEKGKPAIVHKVGKEGLRIEGEILKTDPVLARPKGAPHRVFLIELRKGQHYSIDLMSKDFDAYLILQQPASKLQAEDDDGGGALNARLRLEAPVEGAYRLIVASLDRKSGSFQLTVTVRELTADDKLAAEIGDLQREAKRLFESGQAAKAVPLIERTLAISEKLYPPERYPDGHSDLAGSLTNFGVMLNGLGRRAEALPYFERALAMCEKLYPAAKWPRGHLQLAGALLNVGAGYDFVDHPAKALPHLERALAMHEALLPPERFANGRPELALNLHNLGVVLQHLHQPSKARVFHERALAMREKLYPIARFPNGHPALASSLTQIGHVYRQLGQPSKALAMFEQALAMHEKLIPADRFPHPDLAASLNGVGGILVSLGQPAKGLPYLERALSMHEKLYPPDRFPDGHPYLAGCLNNVGIALYNLRGKALPVLERALAMQEKLYPPERFPDGHPEILATLNSIGVFFNLVSHRDKALPYFERALAMSEKLYPAKRFPEGHPAVASALKGLAAALVYLGRAKEAFPLQRRALAMREKLFGPDRYPHGHEAISQSLHGLSFTLAVLDQPREALEKAEQALAMQQRLSVRESLLVSEAAALDYVRAMQQPTLDILLSLTERLPDEAPTRLYAHVWTSKALLTRVLERRQDAARLMRVKDPKVAAIWKELSLVRQELGGLFLADPREVKDRDDLVRDLSDRKEKLEAVLAKALPEFGRRDELAEAKATALAEILPKDALVLDFIRYQQYAFDGAKGAPHYVVFVISKERGVQMVRLGPAEPIDAAIRDWRRQIQAREAQTAVSSVVKFFWAKIAPHLPAEAKTIYVAPDGDLGRLPFAALPGRKPGTILLEDYLLAQAPHAQFLLERLAAPPSDAKAPTSLLAIGDVRYDLVSEMGMVATPWPELKFTGPEVRQIIQLDIKREVRLLAGDAATVANALLHLPHAGYAHFATHAFFEEKLLTEERERLEEWFKDYALRAEGGKRLGLGLRNPLSYTGLVLAGANASLKAGKERGILTSEAIVDLPLEGLRLAVLSGCDTGLGKLTAGEGVAGLQRAFHLAGCPNVVASLWKVDDAATAALMNKFYHAMWRENKAPLEALRDAQLTIHRHPDLIPMLAGERGRPELEKALRLPDRAPAAATRSETRLWAAFVLSGVGK